MSTPSDDQSEEVHAYMRHEDTIGNGLGRVPYWLSACSIYSIVLISISLSRLTSLGLFDPRQAHCSCLPPFRTTLLLIARYTRQCPGAIYTCTVKSYSARYGILRVAATPTLKVGNASNPSQPCRIARRSPTVLKHFCIIKLCDWLSEPSLCILSWYRVSCTPASASNRLGHQIVVSMLIHPCTIHHLGRLACGSISRFGL